MNLPTATYQIIYNGKNISRDISDMVMSLSYTDKIEGGSDEIEITVEDINKQWINNWYPQKGDTIQISIYCNGQQLNCGAFTVDEIEAAEDISAGNLFTFKGVAAAINKQLRTKRSYAHEKKTLREIANTVAANLGLTVQGSVKDITIDYASQYRETDLTFLNRIGGAYGYVFSVRGNNLVFLYYEDVESKDAKDGLIFGCADRIKCTYKDTTNKVYKSVSLKHHSTQSKSVLSFKSDDDGIDYGTTPTTLDITKPWLGLMTMQTPSTTDNEDDDDDESGYDDLNMYDSVENKQQAEAKGKYALHRKNTQGVTCEIELPGNVLFISGNNFQINEAGHFNGKYQITEATHKITTDGSYSTSGSGKRLGK